MPPGAFGQIPEQYTPNSVALESNMIYSWFCRSDFSLNLQEESDAPRLKSCKAWKKNLASIPSLLEKKEYRHGVRAISASSIGTQYFCEVKLDQSYIHGEIETEEKTEGDVLHEELLAMKPTTQKTLLGNEISGPSLQSCASQIGRTPGQHRRE
jgi:hypothetical protein